MKMNVKSIFAAFAAFTMVLSCSKVEGPVDDSADGVQDEVDNPSGQITISATLSDAMTKVSFTPSFDADGKTESLALAWEAGDKLRIYNHDDKTQYEDFELDQNYVGKKTGVFKGNVFEAASYDVEIINGDLAYATQIQPSDGVTSSLKYFASASEITDLGAIVFAEYSSVLAITAKMPEGVAENIASVDIAASEAIFNAGNTLTIALGAKGDKDADNILHLFANLPKGDQQIPEGTTLFVRFNAPETDHTVYTRYIELDAQTFTSGKLNTINVNASASDKHAGLATCDGSSAEKAYLIGDKYQMQAMHSLMTADATTYFKMVDDVDLEGIVWEPLNPESPWSKGIYFDGAEHTISNFSSNGETYSYPSFAGILNGTVCNVTFDKANVQCADKKGGIIAGYFGHKSNALEGHCVNVKVMNSTVTSTAMSGAFAAQGDNVTTLSKCSVIDTEVTSTGNRVGGFIGSLVQADDISDCTAEGVEVNAGQYAGGFIGNMAAGTLTGCSASGSVTSSSSYVGGLVGNMDAGTLTCCSAENVIVSGSFYAGGIVGVFNGNMSECYATGSVSAEKSEAGYSFAGGLIGNMVGGNVSNSYSECSLTISGRIVGGLVGRMTDDAKVDNCFATGKVTTTSTAYGEAGGLVGKIEKGTGSESESSITKCYATGIVKSDGHYAGGLIGSIYDASILVEKCYASGDVTLPSSVNKSGAGGFVGNLESGAVVELNDSYSAGTVTAYRWSACFVGRVQANCKLTVTNSYTKSRCSFTQPANCGLFVGDGGSFVTYKGVIGWNEDNLSLYLRGLDNSAVNTTDNYFGTEGTISAKAKAFEWDETIWDLNGDVPVLKWTL